MDDRTMIELVDLCKQYNHVRAVDNLSLTVRTGEIFGFLGPNGAGKTTTIKMIAGILQPTSGRVIIDGHDLNEAPERAKKAVGFIPDRPFLYEKLTGYEFLEFIGGLYGVNSGRFDDRARSLLELFELWGWRDELIEGYSHGMKQRLIMTSALLHQPRILVVDEPMVGLDPRGARLVVNIFRQLKEDGASVFVSTHTLSLAAEICDRVGIILQGRLLVQGSVQELINKAGDSPILEDAFLKLTGGADEQAIVDFLRLEKSA